MTLTNRKKSQNTITKAILTMVAIVVCNDFRIGRYYSRRVVIRNPLRLLLVLASTFYLEVFIRTMEASVAKNYIQDPASVPFFVDRVSKQEEQYMERMKKSIDRVVENDGEVCLTHDCLDKVATKLARAYTKPDFSQWCVTTPPEGLTESDYYGLLMVKVPKSASSTAAAVTLRIREELKNRTAHSSHEQVCRVEYDHRLAIEYAKAPVAQRFLWTSIRDPTKRAMSRIFFTDISYKNHEPTDDIVLQGLTRQHHKFGAVSPGQGGFQVKYTTLHSILEMSAWNEENRTLLQKPERVALSVKRIVDTYGFMALVERMDESLVVLSMLLNVPLTDVLISSSSKVAGSSYFMRFGKCVKLVKAFQSPAVKEYLRSKEWLAQNYGDTLLHMTVNKSLDMTIDQTIGRSAYQRKLAEYKRLKELDLEKCAPHTILPCSKDGVNQVGPSRHNCYTEDYGCGYPCIDQMLRDDSLHTKAQRAMWKPSSSSWF
jgi:hypothetical protein